MEVTHCRAGQRTLVHESAAAVRGLEFQHIYWLNADNKPMTMRVTKIALNTVYYRPVLGGSPMCCDVASFDKYALPVSR